MLKVRFNMVDEFCEEMKKDKDIIDRKIIRVTQSFTPSHMTPNIRIVEVLASYSVSGQIVRLEKRCGEFWGVNTKSDQDVIDKADEVMKIIKDKAAKAGLQVRAGVLEES